jgi:tetraacyldisaccharide 4'-kinase
LYEGGFLRRYRLKKPVVSVGNLSVGGTGKTPFVIWLWRQLCARSLRASVLTRGYRREDQREPLLFTSTEGAERAGDEVRLLLNAGVRPVGVAARREMAGVALEAENRVDLHLLDDGFQHLSLLRDLDIVLLDCTRPPWELDLLPAGRLREPFSALTRAGVIVLTRAYAWTQHEELERVVRQHNREALLVRSATEVIGVDPGQGPFFAFAGIGNPKAFFDDLGRARAEIRGHLAFPDHHRYTSADMVRIEKRAREAGARALVTTEKDWMNLEAVNSSALPLVAAGLNLLVENEEGVVERVMEVVK